jgi:hypothetical protein
MKSILEAELHHFDVGLAMILCPPAQLVWRLSLVLPVGVAGSPHSATFTEFVSRALNDQPSS